jgi:hypothetical protein
MIREMGSFDTLPDRAAQRSSPTKVRSNECWRPEIWHPTIETTLIERGVVHTSKVKEIERWAENRWAATSSAGARRASPNHRMQPSGVPPVDPERSAAHAI